MPELIQSVADCPNNTANRDLTKEEIDLRCNWMMISYLTLETIDRLEGKTVGDLSIADHVREKFGSIIEQRVRKYLGMEASEAAADVTPSDPQVAAIMAYNMKVMELTLSNVEDARFANEKVAGIDEDGVGPPRPNIPGAFK